MWKWVDNLLSELSWVTQLPFPYKIWRKVYIKKQKLGSLRKMTCLGGIPLFNFGVKLQGGVFKVGIIIVYQ